MGLTGETVCKLPRALEKSVCSAGCYVTFISVGGIYREMTSPWEELVPAWMDGCLFRLPAWMGGCLLEQGCYFLDVGSWLLDLGSSGCSLQLPVSLSDAQRSSMDSLCLIISLGEY